MYEEIKDKVNDLWDDGYYCQPKNIGRQKGNNHVCREILSFIEEKEKESKELDEPKIKGWVARENPNTNLPATSLSFFSEKPQKRRDIFGEDYWGTNGGKKFTIPKDAVPQLTWEDEPIEVELTIHRVC